MNKNTHKISAAILHLAKKKRRRVAISLLDSSKEIEHYLKLANRIAKVVVVGQTIKNFECYPAVNHEEIGKKLLWLLDSKKVDAICKGQLHPRVLYLPLWQRRREELAYFDGSKTILPIIFEHTRSKRFFLLTSGDLWQGFKLEQKKREVIGIVNYLKEFGIEPFVGIMSMRRSKPKGAKPIPGFNSFPVIEETFRLAELTLKFLNRQGIKADFFNIEYESALNAGVNIIVPPLGPIGNAIARILNFFTDEWEGIGIPALHFRPLIFEDTFRTGVPRNWYNHIISAAASVNSINKIYDRAREEKSGGRDRD